ncbi:hypothetical protein M3Y99_00343600 [Aphelenchoides fujianensis]|nr:hypothetical protein M3Y99_00343600 [Aphelenchoides fujianensis]
MRGELKDDLKAEEPIADEAASVEKQQELLLMNKLASGGKLPPKTQSNFLQKKLQQRKFFDSGDYAMNQDKEKKHQRQLFGNKAPVEGSLPTIKPTAPVTKITTPAAPAEELQPAAGPASPDKSDSDDDVGLQIPTPNTVPQRKASILHPYDSCVSFD